MRRKVKRLHRLVSLHNTLHRCEQARLAQLSATLGRLETREKSLLDALGEGDSLNGRMVVPAVNYLHSLARQKAKAETGLAVQLQEVERQKARSKAASERHEAAVRSLAQAIGLSDLTDAVERQLLPKGASLPKA